MKVAVVYNRESTSVINLFGVPNREVIGRRQISRIVEALEEGGHEVTALEGDKDLVARLEEFMPGVLRREDTGLVFNLSYGIQGRARYTHVPSILEMLGIPYVGSGPLAHSLALDKIVTKTILVQQGIPTPEFGVVGRGERTLPDLPFPWIVKPQHEAMSLGIRIAKDADAAHEAVAAIHEEFAQDALVERFVDGAEVYVALLGNEDLVAFPPVEVRFAEGPSALLHDDKTGASGRDNRLGVCNDMGRAEVGTLHRLAKQAFRALDCNDMARVDFRIDPDEGPQVLEVNTLPGLGDRSPYPLAAEAAGLGFTTLVNRLVETAHHRYFGARPSLRPVDEVQDPLERLGRRVLDRSSGIEDHVLSWTAVESRTSDAVSVQAAARRLGGELQGLSFGPVPDLTDGHHAWTWAGPGGLDGGVLLAVPLDVPVDTSLPAPRFRRHRAWLEGEGIASSRASLAMVVAALRALHEEGRLAHAPLGVVAYGDAGLDGQYSAPVLWEAARRSGRFLCVDSVPEGRGIAREAPGRTTFAVTVESGEGAGPASGGLGARALRLLAELDGLEGCSSLRHVRSTGAARLAPRRFQAELVLRFDAPGTEEAVTQRIQGILDGSGLRTRLERTSRVPPLRADAEGRRLADGILSTAGAWSVRMPAGAPGAPTFAGFAPEEVPAVGGLGPPARGIGGTQEAVHRLGLIERTVVLACFLAGAADGRRPDGGRGRPLAVEEPA